MNYNYLLYFSVLAETEHYTQAAARLGISQPSLSSAIHNLENDLGGIRLFEKVGRNVRLTDHGRFYQQKVDAALKELHSASRILRDSKDDAPIVIRLGVVSGTLEGAVANEITRYIKENNRIRLQITESSAENLMSLLRHEQLDMAIVDSTSRDPSFHFRILCKRNFYIALPKSHPLAGKTSIQPADVISLPQVVFNYDVNNSFKEWASGTPADENVVCQVNTAQAALDMVAAGVGIAFIPDSCVREHENISFVLLENWHQALYMCILYDKWLEPSIWQFRENIMNAIRNAKPEK
ncbi:MAG: LysR family transcriptional regulator [Lachnospiraceae bacterium]|nr:LysR family transcriptional regulator [Lachnospiraceae bacterium]